jgi:hypothetical protein
VGFPLPSLIACQALARMSPLFVCLYFGVGLFCFFSVFALADFCRVRFGGAGFEEEEEEEEEEKRSLVLLG